MVLGFLSWSHNTVPLLADAALPLIYFTLPAVVLLLIPVILLEGFLPKIWLPTSIGRALRASSYFERRIHHSRRATSFLAGFHCFDRGESVDSQSFSAGTLAEPSQRRFDVTCKLRLHQRLCRRSSLVASRSPVDNPRACLPDFLVDRILNCQKADPQEC